MEIVSEDGSKTQIKPGQTRELGREHGLNSSDKTISRRQVSLFIPENQDTLIRFEVLGRNPIYVSKEKEVQVFRRFERGEIGDGDMFCVSAKNPVWHTLRKNEDDCGEGVRRNDSESEFAANLESRFENKRIEDLQHESVDNSNIDPVKEFGFVVIGHEFDSFPKKMIRDIGSWDWFIEEARKYNDDDDDDSEGKKRKRKRGNENNDDDEWTGESEEDDKVIIEKLRKAQRPKYTTRSKNRGEPSKSSNGKRRELDDDEEEEDEDEDEGDETLGGFIVDDEKLDEDEDEEIGDDEEEEDEYDEDE